MGTCNSCPTQARWSPSAVLLPNLAQKRNVDILTESSCLEIISGEDNRAVECMVHTKGIIWKARFRNLVLGWCS